MKYFNSHKIKAYAIQLLEMRFSSGFFYGACCAKLKSANAILKTSIHTGYKQMNDQGNKCG
jgi:hypothetical protein